MKFLARAFLTLIGLALLLPGACALAVVPASVRTLIYGTSDFRHGDQPFLLLLCLAGLVSGALGIFLLRAIWRR